MVRMALVGCGGMAHWHAQQIGKISEIEVAATVDILPERAQEFKDKYFKAAQTFESFEGMLRQMEGKVDVVLLVTPHTVHYPQAKAALEHGIHVMTEKPMVTSSEHAYDLWRTVKKTGKMLGITFQAPYSAEYGYLAAERDAGRLGKIQMVSGWLTQDWLKNTVGKWRQDPALSGGGMLYDSGAHLLNGIMWLMNDPVVEVGCFYDQVGSPVDINGTAIMKFQNGAIGSVTIGGNCPPFKTEMQIITDKLLIETDQYGGKLEMRGRDGKKVYPKVEQDERAGAGTPHRNFIDALAGKEKLRAPVRYGVLLSALMDAMYESARSGELVKVKPVPAEI